MSPERSLSVVGESPPQSPSTPTIDSDLARPSAKPKKHPTRRASVACVACRDRKIKCDGNAEKQDSPCSQCKHLDKPCVFRMDDRRKRKWRTSEAYIKRLQDRIEELQRNQKSSSPIRVDDGSSSGSGRHTANSPFSNGIRVSFSEGPTHAISALGEPPSGFRDCPSIIRDPDTLAPSISNYQMMDWQFDILELNAAQLGSDQNSRAGVPPKSIEARNYMISQLYAAMGQLDADEPGQLMNLHITSFLPPSSPESMEPVTEDLVELADSKDTQTHLLDLYFSHQDPLLQVLLEEPFMSNFATGVKTQYFSKFLLYSVLLNALRLSDDPSIRNLNGVYLKRAKQELVFELENPTISTIQALCVFADYRGSGLGHDKACSLYAGIAFRMLYDLGLNRDGTDLMAMGYISEHDLQVRHDVFWGCYVYDKFYSIYLGRPSTIKLPDVAIPRPSTKSNDLQLQTRVAWCNLCTILSDVIDIANGPSSPHLLKRQSTMARFSSMSRRLLQWRKELPVEVQWDQHGESPPSPGVYALHMQFHTTIIMLYRPFAGYTAPSPSSGMNAGKQLVGHTPILSRQVCNENAVRFAKLLLAYREHYTIQKVFSSMLHMIFIAATTLISQLSTNTNTNGEDNDKKWLAVCLQALDDLTPTFHIAGRVHRVIASFLEGCGYSEFAPVRNTRGDLSKSADQQHVQQDGLQSQGLSHDVYPTTSLTSNPSEGENISDTTLVVPDFGLRQAFPYHTASQTYAGVGGLEGLLNMDSYQSQSAFHEFEKAGFPRTNGLETNFLCT